MSGNTFGKIFTLTSFGESHGIAIGGVIDGCPAGLTIDYDFIQNELNRRRPGQSELVSPRNETDQVEFISGIYKGKTTGTPIAFIIKNQDFNSEDYSHLEDAFRPGHADFSYQEKYGFRDHRGGGRSSARETIARVVAGAIAQLILKMNGITIHSFVSQIKDIKIPIPIQELDFSLIESNAVRCPHLESAEKMIQLIKETKERGDTVGGIVSCVVEGLPSGLGEPVFDKLHADLGKAMLSINAVKGFQIGKGFDSVNLFGSELNDVVVKDQYGKIMTQTNHSGGVQGGISNGMPVYFEVAFKPVSTLMQNQETLNSQGENIVLEGKGRHDPCVLPRAIPIVDNMSALVLVDHFLRNKSSKI